MGKIKAVGLSLSLIATYLFSSIALAEYKLNMTPGVTPISHAIYDLHMTIFWICVGIGVVVFGVMFYALIWHRKRGHHEPAKFHEHVTVEVIWATIPFIILVLMAIPATKVLLMMDDESDTEMNVKVTGYQWRWHYDYLEDDVKFFSNLSTPEDQIMNKAPKDVNYLLEVDNPLVLPVDTKVRFLVTADDVLHSWWVPALGVKRDAVPGYIHEAWAIITEPGIYRGQCAELCGKNHGFMPIVVDARSKEDYQTWLTEQREQKAQMAAAADKTWTQEELMGQGEKAYVTYCAACHKADGSGMPPAFPALKDSPIAKGPVDKHIQIVLHGVAGSAMQAFGGQLSDVDLAAVITYERNAWGNDVGDVVQPAEIKKLKGGSPAAAAEDSSDAAAEPKEPESNEDMTKDELMAHGEEIYLRTCAVCHKPDGTGMPPAFPPMVGSKIVDGPVADHIDIVLNGKQGSAMQAFGSQLSNRDLAAVVTYERNAWNDGKGGLVQPKDIEAARQTSKGE